VSVSRLTPASRPPAESPIDPQARLGWALSLRHLAVLEAAFGLWFLAIAGTKLDAMAGFGLLDAVPIPYYLAVTLLLAGFAVAASQRETSTRILGGYVVGLAVMLHGTTALIYSEPRYVWTYKHLGVTNFIGDQGHFDRAIDIYQNWPGFFALGAWLSKATGLEPIQFAGYAQVFFALAGVAVLLFVLRAITANAVVRWTAAFLFLLTDWLAQNIYAPQALGFLLSLLVIGLCLRCAPPPPVERGDPRPGIRGWPRRAREAAAGWYEEPPLAPAMALVVGAVLFVAVVVSHQLSPVLLIVQVLALALVFRRVPLWVVGGMVVIQAAWMALAWEFLDRNVDIFAFEPGSTPASDFDDTTGVAGVSVVNFARPALMLGIVALAVLGWIRARNRLNPAAIVLMVAPFLVLAVTPYGGEGILRSYLFALPWCCVLAAVSLRRQFLRVPSLAALAASAAVFGSLFLLAYYGGEERAYVTPDDVAVATWYEQNAPAGSRAATMVPVHPGLLTSNYPALADGGGISGPSLSRDEALRGQLLGDADLPEIARLLDEEPATRQYVILTPIQERVSETYTIFEEGSFKGLRDALSLSPDYRLVYRHGGGYVFERLDAAT
jgi:hypothetical protein